MSFRFISPGTPSTPLIIITEITKIFLSFLAIYLTVPDFKKIFTENLSFGKSLRRAGPPAALYSVQNWLILLALTRISPLSLSLLNQTKTLSAAFFARVMLDKKQSVPQLFSLVGLSLGAALIIFAEGNQSTGTIMAESSSSSFLGYISVMFASLLSGFSSAITERTLTRYPDSDIPRNAMSLVFSMELACFGILTLLSSIVLGLNPDVLLGTNPFRNWTIFTFIPIIANASGGLLVGIVTQRVGGVKKGFALILGICFATAFESILTGKILSLTHYLAVLLVCCSMWLYFSFPFTEVPPASKKDD